MAALVSVSHPALGEARDLAGYGTPALDARRAQVLDTSNCSFRASVLMAPCVGPASAAPVSQTENSVLGGVESVATASELVAGDRHLNQGMSGCEPALPARSAPGAMSSRLPALGSVPGLPLRASQEGSASC